jgi:hypothetical protein
MATHNVYGGFGDAAKQGSVQAADVDYGPLVAEMRKSFNSGKVMNVNGDPCRLADPCRYGGGASLSAFTLLYFADEGSRMAEATAQVPSVSCRPPVHLSDSSAFDDQSRSFAGN